MPKKDREERRVLQMREEQKELAEKGRRPPLQCTTHPQPESPHPQGRWRRMVEEAERQVEEARWLEDVGRSPSSLPT